MPATLLLLLYTYCELPQPATTWASFLIWDPTRRLLMASETCPIVHNNIAATECMASSWRCSLESPFLTSKRRLGILIIIVTLHCSSYYIRPPCSMAPTSTRLHSDDALLVYINNGAVRCVTIIQFAAPSSTYFAFSRLFPIAVVSILCNSARI